MMDCRVVRYHPSGQVKLSVSEIVNKTITVPVRRPTYEFVDGSASDEYTRRLLFNTASFPVTIVP
jgi:hypothetical protein